jgi:hypothetical protein
MTSDQSTDEVDRLLVAQISQPMARATPPMTRTSSYVLVTESSYGRISAPIAAFIMDVTHTASAALTDEFESEEELLEEQRTNLSMGQQPVPGEPSTSRLRGFA